MKKFYLLVLLCFLIMPNIAFADGMNYLSYSLKAVGSVIIVVSLLFASVWVLKKVQVNTRKSGRIKIIERTYIDNKHSLLIVQVKDKELLLGIGNEVHLIMPLCGSEIKQYEDNT